MNTYRSYESAPAACEAWTLPYVELQIHLVSTIEDEKHHGEYVVNIYPRRVLLVICGNPINHIDELL
jgi:hypothetical protein